MERGSGGSFVAECGLDASEGGSESYMVFAGGFRALAKIVRVHKTSYLTFGLLNCRVYVYMESEYDGLAPEKNTTKRAAIQHKRGLNSASYFCIVNSEWNGPSA